MRLEKEKILPLIIAALKEDIGPRDLTTSLLIAKEAAAEAEVLVRQEGVIAGLQVAEWTFAQVEPKIRFKPTVPDGERVHPGKAVAFLEGPARGILMGERTALNFLGRLSGIATLTRRFVDRVARSRAWIMDTRKTTPTLRLLEKYAVAMGGGAPHRMGLYDQVLIKDNHLKLISGRGNRLSPVERAVREARSKLKPSSLIEVEAASLREFRQALSAQADIILLDNMKISDIQEAVRLRDAVIRSKKGRQVLLEASGGVTLETVQGIAAAGVDRISIGALTHSAPALDIALELIGGGAV
ncbi:MAG: carboxylating nicotinate-nucleotide diphosphorylase [Candidatus Omnitrophica bacterium]|nr:carboxylating nicotinate-nucleotide diphosphorylase [Candidatus Omnitrophota bacterium]